MDRLKIVRDPKTLRAISELHTLCFRDDHFQIYAAHPQIFGNIYTLTLNKTLLGYTIYGQVWLPDSSDAYISSIAIHPQHRKHGWGLKMLNAILTDLSGIRPDCPAVYADIRQSNIAS